MRALRSYGRISDQLAAVLGEASTGVASSSKRSIHFARATEASPGLRWFSSNNRTVTKSSEGKDGLPPWLTMAGGAVGVGLLARSLFFKEDGGSKVIRDNTEVVILDDVHNQRDIDEDVKDISHAVDSTPMDEKEETDTPKAVEDHQVKEEQQKQQEVDKSDHEEEKQQIIDSRVVLSSIESVLTKTADTMLKEDAISLGASSNSVNEEHSQGGLAGEEESVNNETMSNREIHDSDVTSEKMFANVRIGDDVQITASKLIELANERMVSEMKSELDFKEFPARHKQAEADAQTLEILLESYKQEHHRQIKQMKSTENAFKDVLKNLESMQQELLEAQAKALHIKYEKDITRERVKRQEMLDSARLQLDAVSDALSRQSVRAQKSQEAHKISTAVFHIREGIFSATKDNMSDVKSSFKFLQSIEDDPIIQLSIASLQACGMSIKQQTELLSEFEQKVKKPVVELAYIPEGKGGILTSLVAKIASALKVENDCDDVHGVSKCVQDGNLVEAADKLLEMLQGTAAMHAAESWLNDVKKHATAHQALKILEARAACINDIHSPSE